MDSPGLRAYENNSSLVIDDSSSESSESSATIQNDPDRAYYVEQIDLTEDDGEPQRRASSVARPRQQSIVTNEIIDLASEPHVSLEEGDYLTDECFERLISDWDEHGRGGEQPAPTPALLKEPEKFIIPEACVDGIVYKAGQSVELHDGSYLRIAMILSEPTGLIYLRGRRLFATLSHPGTYIPKKQNELIWITYETADVPLEIVNRFVIINFTNDAEIILSALVCRMKETRTEGQASVEYLSFNDADPGFTESVNSLRKAWRGDTRPFGDADKRASLIDLTSEGNNMCEQRAYTFGDGFCGAGGMSSGAHRAGLHIKWSFDNSPHATDTYRRNFESAVCEQSDIFTFLTNEENFLRVDLTHGSPPCQTFSPAHTINSDRDDANSACIFSCADLIKKAKPRVHTMEETSGLFDRHRETFYRVIQDFIEIGYSVRWTVLNCMDYGVPQSRKRLIIIASGPGESLPPFPKPTHGLPGSGLTPFTTINSMISNIPINAADHDVEGALERGLRSGVRAPFNSNQPARTITCGGGENNYHPSEQRGFTNREFACLQTFPLEHRFGPREVRKQIGNAVPPALSRAIYGEIIKSLQETDAKELPREARSNMVIELE